ncbi:flagellar hook-associated protein FlgK [Alkalihalophilus marmarensis]|jgi:flagellar hook-associated protein 1 FlgK|uniref:flagellar hook-associated protein FlgK n=1 Tax=Alkalihalophilus marmarensis TaxID=521377 RepID=UPI002040FFA2|nr:flagellar hook-associated protein FlgK [Alkalihalophilus marmarensis]MCM3489927.1 flagellar hook-associated protein FlgK [Alkalihalophilus marmarensis]
MKSTFHGLETARRAMMTQQYALHTTGHNIANANTPGYTRQRVNFTQTEPYPNVGMNRPMLPGHLGTGVKAGSIQRVREHFLDVQFRNENNKVGYYGTKYEALTRMEDILNEPSEQGLASLIDQFWGAMQDLSGDPEDTGARVVARSRAEEIANTFNYLHSSLSTVQDDYKAEIDVTIKGMNSLLSQLNDVNQQIRSAEPHGYVPNDLYDEQDRILDQLSQIIDIEVKREPSGGKPNPVAEGAVTVILKGLTDEDGNPKPIKLVDGTDGEELLLFHEKMDTGTGTKFNLVRPEHVEEEPLEEETKIAQISYEDLPRGELKALVEAFGYGENKGLYPEMLANLNELAMQFAKEVNAIHKIGFTLPDMSGNVGLGGDFFTIPTDSDNPAASLAVANNIKESTDNIAAASVNTAALKDDVRVRYLELVNKNPKSEANYEELREILSDNDSFISGIDKAFAGDGSNALRLSNMKNTLLTFFEDGKSQTANIMSFYQGVIGGMAVKTQEAGRMLGSSEGLRSNVEFNRQAVSNVSLDEEMTMMIQFQHAYNAAARNITMVDEMLDRIINGMGVVGR